MLNLGYAGRFAVRHGIHRAIAALTTDDPLFLQEEEGRWDFLDAKGNCVGRLSRSFAPPGGMRCIAARVMAVVARRREDEGPEFQRGVCSDRWEVVLPELILEPGQ